MPPERSQTDCRHTDVLHAHPGPNPAIGTLLRRLGLGLWIFALPILAAGAPYRDGNRPEMTRTAVRTARQQPGRNWNRRTQTAKRRPLGNSLERLHQLPLDRQIRELQNDPGFRRLPPKRQQRIVNRLRWFNSLPPEKQQRVLTRMHHLGELNADQRKGLEQIFQAWKGFPPERRQAFRHAYHQLNRMTPGQQQQMLQSDAFKSRFSPQEAELLQQALSLHLPQDVVGSRPPQNQR